MTAEIAILNKSAIALAADSKVTLTLGGRQKTYDTVDKLFSLSKTEPVGAMIYGNAEFMRFPWETILKQYRRQNPRKRFPSVFDWADDLKAYLLNFFPFNGTDEAEVVVRTTYPVLQSIVQDCLRAADPDDDRDAIALRIRTSLMAHATALTDYPDFFTPEEWTPLAERLADTFTRVAEMTLGDAFKDIVAPAVEVAQFLVRKQTVSNSASGLVVAGFGERELLPSLVAFQIDGIIGGRLKAIETHRCDVTRNSEGTIIPFAQSDMVYRFMEGIDPDYATQILADVGELLLRNAGDTAKALGHSSEEVDSLRPALEAAVQAALTEFWDSTSKIRRERFAEPIIDMAMRLPKDELAHLAESLVSLTSLQRRVSREIETVGGAIDVAVISKGDGFVWIKRKHYFSSDRNLRFVNAYFNEYAEPQRAGED